MEVLTALLGITVGLVFGVVITKMISKKEEPIGTLRIDNSDPDEPPQLFLELTAVTNPNTLKNKKYVLMKVKAENYISHN